MEANENDKMIPQQRVGSKLDTAHEVTAQDEAEARALFSMATERLLDVNIWDKICGALSAKFVLTGKNGEPVTREARPGDHFRIDIPGPGPSAGDGFDWVEVEALDDKRNPNGEHESVTIRVRPSGSPDNNAPDTAHFFKDTATSSFRVERVGKTVRAEVHGRNEVPNTDAENASDKVRNAVVGTGATVGLSSPQWNSLVKGLLDTSKNIHR
jgi:hypothetical protein